MNSAHLQSASELAPWQEDRSRASEHVHQTSWFVGNSPRTLRCRAVSGSTFEGSGRRWQVCQNLPRPVPHRRSAFFCRVLLAVYNKCPSGWKAAALLPLQAISYQGWQDVQRQLLMLPGLGDVRIWPFAEAPTSRYFKMLAAFSVHLSSMDPSIYVSVYVSSSHPSIYLSLSLARSLVFSEVSLTLIPYIVYAFCLFNCPAAESTSSPLMTYLSICGTGAPGGQRRVVSGTPTARGIRSGLRKSCSIALDCPE